MVDRRYMTWSERCEQKEAYDHHWANGAMGDRTYTLSLELLGYTEREARDELAAQKTLKQISLAAPDPRKRGLCQ